MDYNKLVSVTGMGGLYELISSKSDGGVVRSLEDNSTKFVSTRVHSFSHLESIEVYTVKDNVNLVDVFTAMQQSKEKLPDTKADIKEIKAYFGKVFPDMDFERVYSSDMKKMVKWFDLLTKAKVDIKLSEVTEEEPAADQAAKKTQTGNAAAAAKSTAVKAAPPKKINTPRKMA